LSLKRYWFWNAGGYLESTATADVINSLKSSPYLAGFGFWAVAYDVANTVGGKTWSQRVLALIGQALAHIAPSSKFDPKLDWISALKKEKRAESPP
jgi:hypothetical protein